MLAGRYRCLWLLWDSAGNGTMLFSPQQSSLARETLWLCGTDFAVKQTQDLSTWSWGVVCECEPLETKLYGDSPRPVSRNTPICEEKEQKENAFLFHRAWKAQKASPDTAQLEGSDFWKLRQERNNKINTRNGEEYLEKEMWIFYWFSIFRQDFHSGDYQYSIYKIVWFPFKGF